MRLAGRRVPPYSDRRIEQAKGRSFMVLAASLETAVWYVVGMAAVVVIAPRLVVLLILGGVRLRERLKGRRS